MLTCDYFRHDSNNQTATNTLKKQRKYHLNGKKLCGEAYVALFATLGTFPEGGWHGKIGGAGSPTDRWSLLNVLLGCNRTKRRAWPWNGEGGGNGTGNGRHLGGRQVRGQGGPTGWGRAGRPRKYSPVSREGIGTSTVVLGKGERGGGSDRDRNQDHRGESRASKILLSWVPTRLPDVWQKRIEDLKIIGGAPSPTPLHPHPIQVGRARGGGSPTDRRPPQNALKG